MDAFRGILEVELDALVHVAGVARHDDGPARVRGGHGCHVEALLPLLVDPLEGERVRHLAGTTCHMLTILLCCQPRIPLTLRLTPQLISHLNLLLGIETSPMLISTRRLLVRQSGLPIEATLLNKTLIEDACCHLAIL